eukprot:4948911-Amphidinium_carterae.1
MAEGRQTKLDRLASACLTTLNPLGVLSGLATNSDFDSNLITVVPGLGLGLAVLPHAGPT